MAVTYTQGNNPFSDSNVRYLNNKEKFVSFYITETGNTNENGVLSITHVPIGTSTSRFAIGEELASAVVAKASDNSPLYFKASEIDQETKTIKLYTNSTCTIAAQNISGATISYWYFAPASGTLTADGTTIQTMELSGSNVQQAFAITPSDDNALANTTTAIYVGVDGDVKVDLAGTGTGIVFKNLTAGVFYPIRATKVYATDTTATDIIGVY